MGDAKRTDRGNGARGPGSIGLVNPGKVDTGKYTRLRRTCQDLPGLRYYGEVT